MPQKSSNFHDKMTKFWQKITIFPKKLMYTAVYAPGTPIESRRILWQKFWCMTHPREMQRTYWKIAIYLEKWAKINHFLAFSWFLLSLWRCSWNFHVEKIRIYFIFIPFGILSLGIWAFKAILQTFKIWFQARWEPTVMWGKFLATFQSE